MTQGRGKATPDGILSTVGKALVLAALLSLATQFGLLFRLEHANVSLVWLTSGVATAGLLLLGLAFAPVVWLATWGAGLAGGLSGTFAATLALGTTVGAVLSVVLLRRCVPSGYLLDNLRNLLALVTLGALVNGLALALPVMLVGNTGRPWDDLAGAGSWLLWCLSTANGTLLSVPLVLSLTRRHTSQVLQAKWPELLVLLALSAAAAGFVFGSPGVSGGKPNLSLQLAVFPLIVWGAVRFGYLGVASVAILASVAAMTSIVFCAPGMPGGSIDGALFLMAFQLVMLLAGLSLCATLEEKQLAVAILKDWQRQTQTVLNNLPTLFYVRDLQGRYQMCNRAFADLLGLRQDEVNGATASRLFAADIALRLEENDRAVWQTGKNIQFEERYNAGGNQHVFLTSKFPLYDRHGKLIGICANGVDITSRKRAEADLSAAEAKYRALVESSLAGIFIVQRGVVVYGNPELARLLGYTPQELSGRKVEQILWLADREAMLHRLADLVHLKQEAEVCQFRMMHRAGYPVDVEMHSRRLIFDGQAAIFGLVHDIRDRLHTERQLQLYASVFEHANDAICIFDCADRIVAVNDAFCRITGYQRQQVLGKLVDDLPHGMTLTLLQTIRKQLLLEGAWQGEFVGRSASGRHFPAWLGISALRDSDGSVVNSVAMFSDITEVKQVEQAKLAAEGKFRALVELSLVGFYIAQGERIVYANPALAHMLGYRDGALQDMPLQSITAREDWHTVRTSHQRLREGAEQASNRYQYRARCAGGTLLEVEAQGRLFEFQGRPAIIGLVADISASVARERQLRLAAKVFDNASEGILMTDADAQIVAVNPAFSKITGYLPEQALGKTSRMFKSQLDKTEINRDMLMSLEVNGHWQGELSDRRASGELYPAWMSISAVRDEAGRITNYVGVFSDITSRKEAEQRLYFLANHDPLTLLPNRSQLLRHLQQAIAHAAEQQSRVAVLFIDLDRFKTINDTLGHAAGDSLLQEVASRLRGCARSGDLIARLGGDEFTLVMEGLSDTGMVDIVAGRILQTLAEPVRLHERDYYITCSIGTALFPDDGLDAPSLLKNADVAMYRAKENGKNTCQYFARHMGETAYEHLLIGNSLRQAIERAEFELHYQAQVELEQNRIIGLEALLRWRHPEQGLISPERFIPLAEENGLIVPLGEWVMLHACRQARKWQEAGFPPVRMAVNLSPRQFQPQSLVSAVRHALESSGLDPQWLELEITEGMIMRNAEEAIGIMTELKQMGVQLAIDDFGTGYSSLYNLKRFPIHNLKIDRTFVEGLPKDGDDAAIAEVIIAMAKKLGLRVIAEGVENQAQLTFLREQGCDLVQGFMFSKPLPDSAVEQLFHELGIYQDHHQGALPLAARPAHLEPV